MKFSDIPELISFIILAFSFLGIAIIIYRKIPFLVKLPETGFDFNWKNGFSNIFKKIENLPPFKNFSGEIFLQKILSKIRILVLKTDSKTSNWLWQLRERAKRKKTAELDNYWRELRRLTRRKKTNPPA